MQGTTDVAFTVLDVLGYLDEIPVCTAYEVDGKEIHDFPNTSILEKAKPVLKTFRDGNAISAASRNMRICRRTAETTSSL